jgi:uncharacterized protein (DUF433 family)
MAATTAREVASGSTGASRIARDPRVQGGEPVVRGTRTTVQSIVLAARETGGLSGVLSDFPHLSAEDVADALVYYERHRAEIDRLIDGPASDGAL